MIDGSPRILIVRPSALGDVARTVPVLASLRKAYPQAHIDWLVNEPFADAVCDHPALDGIVTFSRNRLAKFGRSFSATREGFALAKTLRRSKYDLVLDCQGLFRSGLFTWLTRAPRRVGLAVAREGATFGYTEKIAVPASRIHTVNKMLYLVESLGHKIAYDMQLYLNDADRQWLDTFQQQHGITEQGYTIIAPTAKWGCKCWPIERYSTLARKLLVEQNAGSHVVVLTGPGEQQHAETIRNNLQPNRRKGDVPVADRLITPATTVGQMMALISKCNLLIANDSAALHIAVGFKRRIVAVFGPTDPAVVGPYRYDSSVIQPPNLDPQQMLNYRRHLDDDTLIRGIEFDAVWEKVVEQMQGTAN